MRIFPRALAIQKPKKITYPLTLPSPQRGEGISKFSSLDGRR
jgi:hypothetical protein